MTVYFVFNDSSSNIISDFIYMGNQKCKTTDIFVYLTADQDEEERKSTEKINLADFLNKINKGKN